MTNYSDAQPQRTYRPDASYCSDTGADPMEFGAYKILDPKQRRILFRYSDDALYAIAMFLFSVEAAANPQPPPADLVERGQLIFTRETCDQCHVPPDYGGVRPAGAWVYTHDPGDLLAYDSWAGR